MTTITQLGVDRRFGHSHPPTPLKGGIIPPLRGAEGGVKHVSGGPNVERSESPGVDDLLGTLFRLLCIRCCVLSFPHAMA